MGALPPLEPCPAGVDGVRCALSAPPPERDDLPPPPALGPTECERPWPALDEPAAPPPLEPPLPVPPPSDATADTLDWSLGRASAADGPAERDSCDC